MNQEPHITNGRMLMITRIVISLLIIIPISMNTAQAQRTLFKGYTLDEDGKAIPYVNVFFTDGDYAGDVSDDSGYFEISTSVAGKRILTAGMIGYEKYSRTITIPQSSVQIIRMREKSLDLKEVTIEASAYTGGEGKTTLNKYDVYTTPGGAADIFQSIKALPGITQTDETAAIPVRGGSPSENLIMINTATLNHPYHGENTAGTGLFTIVETSVMKKLYFSSGGFSVKYGNALSGVLDIETENRIRQNRLNLDVNMVSLGGGFQRVISDNVNMQLCGKKTSTKLLFMANKPSFDVVEDPVSSNLTGIVNVNYSKSGLVQFLGMYSDDAQQFDISLQTNQSRYALTSGQLVGGIVVSDFIKPNWFSKAAVTYSGYRNRWSFMNWSRDNHEYNLKGRWDNQMDINDQTRILFGSEMFTDQYHFRFVLPKRGGEFFNGADSMSIDGRSRSWVQGNYAELQHKLAARWSLSAGIRGDYHDLSGALSGDVRGSLAHEWSNNTFIRFSAGTFHQYPAITLYDPVYGNPNLKPMRAVHAVLGFEKTVNATQLKIEGYYKWYSRLPLENADKQYISRGKGFARGVDFFLKGGIGRLSGWISYSFIQTRRKEFDVPGQRPTIYDITHNIKIIQKTRLGKGYEWSFTARYATGRPFTPVETGVEYGGVWKPVYGERYSERFPAFRRFDTRLTKMIFFGEQNYVALYIEALNLFGTKNILDYRYSEDFSQRSPIRSYFSNRTIVAGISMSI